MRRNSRPPKVRRKANNLLHPKDLEDQNPNSLLSLPFRLGPQNAFTCSEDHGYSDEQSAAHAGAMDMFQDTSHTGTGCQSATQGPFAIANPTDSGFPGTFKAAPTVMAYFDGNTVTALWNYAQNFAMSDNSFELGLRAVDQWRDQSGLRPDPRCHRRNRVESRVTLRRYW